MTISFPLQTSEFWGKIRFAGRPEFRLQSYKQQSMDGAGNLIGSKQGQSKWFSDVMTAGGWHNADLETQAMIKLLIERDGRFYAWDIRNPYPKLDRTGSKISGYAVKVKSVGSNNRSLALKTLRNGYVLSIGDKLSVTDGAGRRALLEVMEAATANGSGDTPEFEVLPFLPAWISANQSVDLIKPLAKFKIVPGSYRAQSGTGNMSGGVSFSMMSVPT